VSILQKIPCWCVQGHVHESLAGARRIHARFVRALHVRTNALTCVTYCVHAQKAIFTKHVIRTEHEHIG